LSGVTGVGAETLRVVPSAAVAVESVEALEDVVGETVVEAGRLQAIDRAMITDRPAAPYVRPCVKNVAPCVKLSSRVCRE
jgi:hypothetical protein